MKIPGIKITVKIGEVEISAEYDDDAMPIFAQAIPDGEELHSEEKDLLMDRVEEIKEKAINAYQRTFMLATTKGESE